MLAVVAGWTDTGRTDGHRTDGRSPDGRSSDFIFCPMLQTALDRQKLECTVDIRGGCLERGCKMIVR